VTLSTGALPQGWESFAKRIEEMFIAKPREVGLARSRQLLWQSAWPLVRWSRRQTSWNEAPLWSFAIPMARGLHVSDVE
jgi:hypothetical protein